MKLEGLNLVNIAFNHWLKKYDFTCRVRGVDTDFFWYPNDDTIGYTFFLDTIGLETWAKLLKELKCNCIIDPFYSIFLHEVFHSETYYTLSEEEIEESYEIKRLMSEDPGSFADVYDTYYHLPIEYEASAAAINFINTYPERVKELVDLVGKAVRLFYKLNEVVNEDLFDF